MPPAHQPRVQTGPLNANAMPPTLNIKRTRGETVPPSSFQGKFTAWRHKPPIVDGTPSIPTSQQAPRFTSRSQPKLWLGPVNAHDVSQVRQNRPFDLPAEQQLQRAVRGQSEVNTLWFKHARASDSGCFGSLKPSTWVSFQKTPHRNVTAHLNIIQTLL